MKPAGEQDLKLQFLRGMRNLAWTVNVVTTDGEAGRAGVTVSAMSSVSADGDAPTMLVCVHHLSQAAQRISVNRCFCVNVLRDDQSLVSETFAGRVNSRKSDKFSCAQWAPMSTGAPRLVNPLAAFDCRLLSADRVGTHYIFVGEVRDIFVVDGTPLMYANRDYGTPVRIVPSAKKVQSV